MPTAMPGIPFLAITGRIVVSTRFLMVFCGSSAAWLTEVVTPMAKQTINARLTRHRFIARLSPIFLGVRRGLLFKEQDPPHPQENWREPSDEPETRQSR